MHEMDRDRQEYAAQAIDKMEKNYLHDSSSAQNQFNSFNYPNVNLLKAQERYAELKEVSQKQFGTISSAGNLNNLLGNRERADSMDADDENDK